MTIEEFLYEFVFKKLDEIPWFPAKPVKASLDLGAKDIVLKLIGRVLPAFVFFLPITVSSLFKKHPIMPILLSFTSMSQFVSWFVCIN